MYITIFSVINISFACMISDYFVHSYFINMVCLSATNSHILSPDGITSCQCRGVDDVEFKLPYSFRNDANQRKVRLLKIYDHDNVTICFSHEYYYEI